MGFFIVCSFSNILKFLKVKAFVLPHNLPFLVVVVAVVVVDGVVVVAVVTPVVVAVHSNPSSTRKGSQSVCQCTTIKSNQMGWKKCKKK